MAEARTVRLEINQWNSFKLKNMWRKSLAKRERASVVSGIKLRVLLVRVDDVPTGEDRQNMARKLSQNDH